MKLIDTHCHLYAEAFTNDLPEVLQRAAATGVEKFFLPAIDSSTHDNMLALESSDSRRFFAMMGLHPCSVKADFEAELKVAENWLTNRKFVAIGEIGLDFYWDKTFINEQYNAFQRQMQLALEAQIPIVIHTRDAMKETIEAVKTFADKGLRGIFHCFGGSYEEATAIIQMGFLLGIGGVVTYKTSGLQQVLDKINLEHLVLETDAPYLTPVPYRGKRNESSYLQYIAERLAVIKGLSVEDIAAATTANAEKIFGN